MGFKEKAQLGFLVLCKHFKLYPASSGFEMNDEVVIFWRLAYWDVIDYSTWDISHTEIIH